MRAPGEEGSKTKRLLPKGSRFSRPVDKKRKPGVLILSAAALILMVVMGYHYLVTVPAQQQAALAHRQYMEAQKQIEELKKKQEEMAKAQEAAAALRAIVIVNTDPTGATVLLAGKSQKSPARFEDIKPGTYTLTVDMPGFVTHTQPLELEGGKEVDLGTIKLVRRVGNLELSSPGVEGANYKLRGPNGEVRRGRLPDTLTGLPEGTYELEAEHRGWPQPAETIQVIGDIDNKKEVVFGYASVALESEPAGATVREGNKVLGTTPMTVGQLRPGTYKYSLDKDGRKPAKVEVTVAQGEKAAKSVELDKARTLTTSNGMVFVWVPAGFYAGKYEVTQGQYQAVTGINPSHFNGTDRPVENLSYTEAQKFVDQLTARERAKGTISGGARFAIPTSDQWARLVADADLTLAATSHRYPLEGTKAVGASEPNELGLFDVLGNVNEWTDTEFAGKKKTRTVRGGNWLSQESNFPNAGASSGAGLGYRDKYTGLRLILLNN